ncbi:MAG: hypothetical protein AAFR76_03150 [Planctomycetota bacterium]
MTPPRTTSIVTLLLATVCLASGCSRSAVLTNATDVPVRASLERELIGSGERTLDAATIAPDGTVRLGPVSVYSERVTLIVQPAGTMSGAVPIRERLGFGTSEFTIVPDEFAPATIRLAPGTLDTPNDGANERSESRGSGQS